MKLRLWPTGKETLKARQYCKLPPERRPTELDNVWVPLSVMEHVSKDLKSHTVTVQDWWAHKNGF